MLPLPALRRRRPDQLLVGFAAETENLEAHALAKLARKGADLIDRAFDVVLTHLIAPPWSAARKGAGSYMFQPELALTPEGDVRCVYHIADMQERILEASRLKVSDQWSCE